MYNIMNMRFFVVQDHMISTNELRKMLNCVRFENLVLP